jgi:hypothetical protein|tara:strand:- start:229 stop:1167 length:939 start_codon:yes stop_codon:yes gene_type:complete
MNKKSMNATIEFNSFNNKKFRHKLRNIVLTSSDGFDLPFLHYSLLGVGNLVLTYLYALYIKSYIKNLEIIPFYPIRIIPIIKDFKYWYIRSSFEFNYKIKHLKRFLYFFLLGKNFKNSFIKNENLFLSTHIVNLDTLFFEKISALDLQYVKKNIVSFLNFDYEIKKDNKSDLIQNKKKNITLGLHLRRGDFLSKKSSSKNFNSSPDINSQIKIIKKIKSKIKIINIYSDQSKSKTLKELSNKLDNYKLNLFPTNANGSKVLQDMMKNDVIILSNSTLSVISCILTNQLALFSNQILPSKLKKYFKNIKEIKC